MRHDHDVKENSSNFRVITASISKRRRFTDDNTKVDDRSMVGLVHNRIPPPAMAVRDWLSDIDVLATCRMT